jgi:hypothetical protein
MSDWDEYVEDCLADIMWARDDLAEWFRYEGVEYAVDEYQHDD